MSLHFTPTIYKTRIIFINKNQERQVKMKTGVIDVAKNYVKVPFIPNVKGLKAGYVNPGDAKGCKVVGLVEQGSKALKKIPEAEQEVITGTEARALLNAHQNLSGRMVEKLGDLSLPRK